MQTVQCTKKDKTAIKSSQRPKTSSLSPEGSVCVCPWGSNRFYIQSLSKERVKKLLLYIYWCAVCLLGFVCFFPPPGRLCGCSQSVQERLWICIRKGGKGKTKNCKLTFLLLLLLLLDFSFYMFSPQGRGREGLSQDHTIPQMTLFA